MSDVTRSSQKIEAADPLSAEQLLPLVYNELRKLASGYLSQEPSGQTLQPTALVHEAYLRLLGGANPDRWNSRGHFFAAAATAIRRILIDNARRKHSLKQGGAFTRHDVEDMPLALPEPQENLLDLDAALHKLAALHPQAAELVQLRYFAGLTLLEAAEILGLSPHASKRLWSYARTWLRREIEKIQENS
jgi:RNA polymerase sigma factor (TIGR02999 family)